MRYQPNDIINGKYRIIEPIGGGAMGEVYRAEHLTIKKLVAIKIMHGEMVENSESVARFSREAQAAAMLDHSNICAVTDFDTTDNGDFYLVMELLNGETLKSRLSREGCFEPIKAGWIMHQLLSALQCAHSHGLVHRDVKPDNIILIQREGRNDFVKLIDFGIAHQDNPEGSAKTLTQAGQIYGTPQYLSPEQALGDPIDFHADLYACGVILYEMLVGVPPFNGTNYIELLHKQISEPPPHLPNTIENSDDLDAVIQILLQKTPTDRYGSADEVIAALDEIILQSHPSSPDAMSLMASIAGASLNRNIQSLSVSLTKVKDDSNDQLLQSSGKIQALLESSSHILAVVPDKWYHNKQKRLVVILSAVIVVIGAVLVFMLFQLNRENKELQTQLEEPKPIVVTTVEEIKEQVAQIEVENVKPEAFNYSESLCRTSFDGILSLDENVRIGSDNCNEKHYEAASENFLQVKDKYWDHPNFLRPYLITMYSIKNQEETIKALEHLIELVPDAGCHDDPRNVGVRSIIYAMLDDKNTTERIKMIFMKSQNPKAAEGVAWLILNTPCNRNQVRFEALEKIYDSLPHDNVPKYLDDSVKVWRPFNKKKSCEDRQRVVNTFIFEEAVKLCQEVSPDSETKSDESTVIAETDKENGSAENTNESAENTNGSALDKTAENGQDSAENQNIEVADSNADSDNKSPEQPSAAQENNVVAENADKPKTPQFASTCTACIKPWYEKHLKSEAEAAAQSAPPPPPAPKNSSKTSSKSNSKRKSGSGSSRKGKPSSHRIADQALSKLGKF